MKLKSMFAAVAVGTLLAVTLTGGAAFAEDAPPPTDIAAVEAVVEVAPEPVVEDVAPAEEQPVAEVPAEAVVEAPAPELAKVKPSDEPTTGHDPVTVCHKPGTPAQKELTFDDDGYVAHINHGDLAGTCPALFDGWVTWQAPNYVPVDPSLEAIGLPQSFVGLGQLTPETCGVTYQQDHYVGTQAAVDAILADNALGGTVQHPEDQGVVTEWAFVSSEPCPEVVTYEPTCTTVTDSAVLVGDGVLTVEGGWAEDTVDVPFSGTLADIGTVLDLDATKTQYLGLHIHTAEGTIVFEEEPSYGGQLWSNATWEGVEPGLGYAALGTIEEYVTLNGDVAVTGITLLYTHPEASTTTVASFTIGCTTYTFVPPVVEPPVDEPPVVVPPVVVPPVVTPPVVTPPVVTVVDVPVASPAPVASPQGSLASTGSDLAPWGLGALVAALVGGSLIAISRRKASA